MDELQKSINKMMGISERTWEKFGPINPQNIQIISSKNQDLKTGDDIQKFINNLMGISDEAWEKYKPR
jgi:DNA-binding ferritin-like protein (Dps family)